MLMPVGTQERNYILIVASTSEQVYAQLLIMSQIMRDEFLREW